MALTVLALYGLCCTLYLAFLAWPREGLARGARGALFLAFALHTVDIGARCVHGVHPVQTPPEALSFSAWLLALGYGAASFRPRLAFVGGFVVPLVLILLVLARLTPAPASSGRARAG
jgi:hypothetical protein